MNYYNQIKAYFIYQSIKNEPCVIKANRFLSENKAADAYNYLLSIEKKDVYAKKFLDILSIGE